jgi:hypothetical protein
MWSDTVVWFTVVVGIYLIILIVFNYVPEKYRFPIIIFFGLLLLASMLYSLWLLSNNDDNTEEDLKVINTYLNILSPQFNFEDSNGNKITYPGITF